MTRPPEPTRTTRRADCPGCGARLWRHVLDGQVDGDGADVHACLSCGHVKLVHVYWDLWSDPHQSTVRGWSDEPLAPDVAAWVGAWPRVVGDYGRDPFFLPAWLRCGSAEELAAVEAHAREAQAAGTPLLRFAAAGWPAEPPPAALPGELGHFRYAHGLLSAPDAAVATAVEGGATTVPGERRGLVTLLAYEKVARQRWGERLAERLTTDRAAALREVAAGRTETTYRSWSLVVSLPPGLRPLVEALVPADPAEAALRDAALAAFDRG